MGDRTPAAPPREPRPVPSSRPSFCPREFDRRHPEVHVHPVFPFVLRGDVEPDELQELPGIMELLQESDELFPRELELEIDHVFLEINLASLLLADVVE